MCASKIVPEIFCFPFLWASFFSPTGHFSVFSTLQLLILLNLVLPSDAAEGTVLSSFVYLFFLA